MLRQPTSNEKIIQAVVCRHAERTCAFVRALVPKGFGDDWDEPASDTHILQGAIQLAVTNWFANGGRGNQIIEVENKLDFNVGDLASEIGGEFSGAMSMKYPDDDLCHFLQQQGIIGMTVDTFSSDDPEHQWEFDDKLYDEMEVEG